MSEFSLDINEIEEDVKQSLNEEKSNLPVEKISNQAEQNAIAIFEADFNDVTQRENIIKPLDDFGLKTINNSASKNSLLSVRCKDMSRSGSESENIGDNLVALNRQIKDLDPSGLDFGKNSFLGNLFNPIKKYFEKYEKAESVIENIIKSLDHSNKVLENDNTTLLVEEGHLRDLTKQLISDVELGREMDKSIEAQIQEAELRGIEQEKIDFVKEEVLFPLRQRLLDMEQMVTINQQGIVSLNVARRNNKELIRGINRAKTITVTALRNGVMIANALYNQKITMDKIKVLNKTTENIISSTSKMLRQQGSDIQKSSSEAMISPEVLKESFNEALMAIEDVSRYKQESLGKMKETIDAFDAMAQEGQRVVDKIELLKE